MDNILPNVSIPRFTFHLEPSSARCLAAYDAITLSAVLDFDPGCQGCTIHTSDGIRDARL